MSAASRVRRGGAPTRTRACSTCGASFEAWPAHGRPRRTCSPLCQLEALDRFIAHLVQARERLADRIEDDAA